MKAEKVISHFLPPFQIQPFIPVERTEVAVIPILGHCSYSCVCFQALESCCFRHTAAMTRPCRVAGKGLMWGFVVSVMARMISHVLVSAQNMFEKTKQNSPEQANTSCSTNQSTCAKQQFVCLLL